MAWCLVKYRDITLTLSLLYMSGVKLSSLIQLPHRGTDDDGDDRRVWNIGEMMTDMGERKNQLKTLSYFAHH